MNPRIQLELELLEKYYQIDFDSNWVKVNEYRLPVDMNWNMSVMEVCIQIPVNYPGVAPYGIYVPSQLQYGNDSPAINFQKIANNKPPFSGSWGMISWAVDGTWMPRDEITKGSNLLNFVNSFSDRFKMGRC